MTTATNPPATAVTENSVVTSQSVEKSIAKPEEAHERPGSTSSIESTDHDLEKQQESDGGPVQPVQSTAESIYPSGKETAAVMTALILAIFLVALVRSALPSPKSSANKGRTEQSSQPRYRK